MNTMLVHYFKIVVRQFVKDKAYSLINLTGLALALACSFLFVLWVQYENNYESAHINRNKIYRVLTTEHVDGEWKTNPHTHGVLGQALVSEFPVFANATFLHMESAPSVLVYNEQPFLATRGEAGSQFFEVFTFEFLQGSPMTAFEGQRPIVISEDFAKKVFGTNSDTIIGQQIYERTRLWENYRSDPPFTITAVVRIPKNTHIRFEALINAEKTSRIESVVRPWNEQQFEALTNAEKTSRIESAARSWSGQGRYTTFVQLAPKASFNDDIRTRMADFLTKFQPNSKRKLTFQPLTDIHLHSAEIADGNLLGEFGEPRYIVIFFTVAIFVVLIAVINYVNLAIARGANRSREAGVRKVYGADKRALASQFLIESTLWSFAAMLVAFAIAEMIIPWFSGVVGAELTIAYSLRTYLTAIALSLFVGLLAGSYSAFYLSSFQPMLSLKGGSANGSKSVLRKTLLSVQLAISIFIMLCTGIVYNQLHYIQNKDIGFDRNYVVGINTGLWYQIEEFKAEALKIANVEAVSIATQSPLGTLHSTSFRWEGKTDDTDIFSNIIYADWDYARVFGLQTTQGRFIPATRTVWGEGGDDKGTFQLILNETAAKMVGMDDVFDKEVNKTRVVGVVKDFHFRSFQEKISPLIIRYHPEMADKVFIRINPYNRQKTLEQIREVFLKFKTDNPFEYFFVDDEYRNMYQKEFRLGRVFLYFSLLSIFIACMGVFSLVAFMVKQRSKEIALRKINGATAIDIMKLFAREFSTLTVVAFVGASPFAWFAMHRWLQNYQYRIGISWWIFAGVLALILALAMLSLIVQVYMAAKRNPVESLKYE